MTENIHKHRILILDFGSQYTQLVARRVRELGVYCELWAWDVTEAQIREFNPSGIILSGGPESTTEENSPRAPQYVFEAGVPVFGVCYGMQTMAMQLGGHVEGSNEREFGYAQVEVVNDSALVRGIEDSLTADGKPLLDVWMSHGDKVTAIPADFVTVASTDNCPFAIMANEEKRFYGVQFHPEVTHTRQGMRMLERFVRDICQCEALWTPAKIIDDAVERIRQQVGDDKVILGLSGGVDSSVTAMLLHRAIGKNLTCVFVDNGLLRLNEAQQGMEMFVEYMYEHFEEFKLLVNGSYGTKSQNFVEHLVDIETEYTYKFMEATGLHFKGGKPVTKNFMHIMNKALFESFFEVVRHDMSKEEAEEYVVMLEKYHSTGWDIIYKEGCES